MTISLVMEACWNCWLSLALSLIKITYLEQSQSDASAYKYGALQKNETSATADKCILSLISVLRYIQHDKLQWAVQAEN